MATVLHVPVLEPRAQEFVDALAAAGGQPLYDLSPADARDVLTRVQSIPVRKLAASIEDTLFPVGPTGSVRIRIVRPEGFAAQLPVVMHFHGGGWILGDKRHPRSIHSRNRRRHKRGRRLRRLRSLAYLLRHEYHDWCQRVGQRPSAQASDEGEHAGGRE